MTNLIFDYDGTIHNCLKIYAPAFRKAYAWLVDNGGEILEDFPPTEEPKWAEWEVSATLNGSGDSYTEIKAWAMNHTAWPARVEENISYNYYFDVSEILAAGLSIDDITIKSNSQQYQEGQQGYATVSGPYKYEGDPTGNTYYAKIQFVDGRAIMPTGQSEHRDEVQFRISIPDAINGQSTKGAWDPTNDWSYEGIPDAPNDLKSADALNDHITMYVDDVLVWGTEPDGTTPKPTQPDTKPTGGEVTVWGDVDLNGDVEIADAVKILCSLTDPENNVLEPQGMINGDVYQTGDGISVQDALSIQKYLAQILKGLPEK